MTSIVNKYTILSKSIPTLLKQKIQPNRCGSNHRTIVHFTGSANNNNNNNNTFHASISGNQDNPSSTKQHQVLINSFSSTSSGNNNNKNSNDDDPFGMNFNDISSSSSTLHNEEETSHGNIGPKETLPPNYIRDGTTGKFTGKVQAELSSKDASFLNLSDLEKDRILTRRLFNEMGVTHEGNDDDNKHSDDHQGTTTKSRMTYVSQRIREEQFALNTIGRRIADISMSRRSDEQHDDDDDNISTSAPLSKEELETLEKYLKQAVGSTGDKESKENKVLEHLLKETKDLIPSVARMSTTKHPADDKLESSSVSSTDIDSNLEWMTPSAQRSFLDVDKEDLDDPFANLLPSDLNPSQKVNRKKAKPIPAELLHHNNIALLRRYITPGGQIMNRVQSRLGAKDQRKVAKLIKRARHLGLIPVLGQWKLEDHGNVKEKDILVERDWEQDLIDRGFLERKSKIFRQKKREEE